MTRWLVLLLALAAWAYMMGVVYVEYGPKPLSAENEAGRQALDALFHERYSPRESWKVYINPLKPWGREITQVSFPLDEESQRARHALLQEAEWAGARPGEVQIGTLVTTTKIRAFTRAEVRTEMALGWPKGFGDSVTRSLTGLAGENVGIALDSLGQFSKDKGLEDVSVKCRTGIGAEAIFVGHREGESFKMMLSLFGPDGKKLLEPHFEVPVTGAYAPSFGCSPFFLRPDIREGDRWTVATLDIGNVTGTVPLTSLEVRVVGRATVRYHGKDALVYQAEGRQGGRQITAWYAPDGQVLVQRASLMNLDLTLIRDEEP